jgi:uncharacterized membrane protein YdjX (TVP38/TMEM64 family)
VTTTAKVGLSLLALLGIGAAVWLLPLDRWALHLVEWIRGAGALGVGVFALVYVLATLAFLPGSLLTAGAGFAYGPLWGTLLVSPVSVLAAGLAFALGRSALRGWVSRRLADHPRFAAIDEAMGQGGFKIVVLLRLSPIFPFNLLNYALGLTRVGFRDYMLASFLGMLPGTFLYVYLGSLVTSASELLSGARPPEAAPYKQALYWGGLVATLVATILITKISRTALERALAKRGSAAASASEARP